MFLMRADPLRGQVAGDWALESETSLGPMKWHRAVTRVPFRAQKSREIISTMQPVHFPLICLSWQTFMKRYLSTCLILLNKQYCSLPLLHFDNVQNINTFANIVFLLKCSRCYFDSAWLAKYGKHFLKYYNENYRNMGALRDELLIEFLIFSRKCGYLFLLFLEVLEGVGIHIATYFLEIRALLLCFM